jgi:hypothetical protein
MHEAAHAAVALFSGLTVVSATIDEPARLGGGVVHLERTEPTLAHLLTVMAGPVVSGTPLTWRPLDLGDGTDEAVAAVLVYLLNLDEDGWRDAAALTNEMLELPPVQRARRAISGALHDDGTLAGSEVRRIYCEATAVAEVY